MSSITNLLRVPCTVLNPGTATDQYGDVQPDEAAGTSVATVCYPSTGTASESTVNGQVSTADWTVFLPAGTTCAATSVVVLADGRRLEATQPPRVLLNARTGQADHVELACRLVA